MSAPRVSIECSNLACGTKTSFPYQVIRFVIIGLDTFVFSCINASQVTVRQGRNSQIPVLQLRKVAFPC